MTRRAVLLLNLGSPDDCTKGAVQRYLSQFLMDRHVVTLPWLIRKILVDFLIVPRRSERSAKAYESIWWPEGSPLVVISQKLHQAVAQDTELPVELAMRYGNPSVDSALSRLAEKGNIDELLVIPLYPHYARSTTLTGIEAVEKGLKRLGLDWSPLVFPPFYNHPAYIQCLLDSARPLLNQPHDHVLFSYHGLPESHLRKADPTGAHCLASSDCCEQPSEAHRTCYRHQVMETTRAFVKAAGIAESNYSVAFQSRLGRTPWLQPFTDDTVTRLAHAGIKKLLVICPSFVSDCLETLEEIGMEAESEFRAAGGEKLTLIPCLNEFPGWIELLGQWTRYQPPGGETTPMPSHLIASEK